MTTSRFLVRRMSWLVAVALFAPALHVPAARGAETHSATATAEAPTANTSLGQLVAGNQRFVAGKPTRARQTAAYRTGLATSQHPFATILGCSDSRVPLELLFDQGFGDLFVIRVAGNVVGTDEVGSIQYAVHHLHTPLVVVLGHESCGAVTSALLPAADRSKEATGIQALLTQIEPALSGLDPKLSQAQRVHQGVEANVRQSVRELQANAELMKPHEGAAPEIVGAVYDLETGKVRFLK
jgi:carbonic anhydrase